MRVLVVSNHASPTYYNRVVLSRALQRRGISFENLNVVGTHIFSGELQPINRGRIAKPDLILMCNTIPIHTYELDSSVPSHKQIVSVYNALKAWQVPSFNNLECHVRAANKMMMAEALQAAKVATPYTVPMPEDFIQASYIVQNFLHYPVVAKTVDGYAATGVYLINNEHDLSAFYRYRVRNSKDVFILQECVKGLGGALHCVCVVGNDVKTTLRLGDPNTPPFMSDTQSGRVQIAIETEEKLRELVLQAMDVLGLDYARLDVMKDHSGEFKILEVNTPGGLNLPDVTFNCDTGQAIVDLMLKKYG